MDFWYRTRWCMCSRSTSLLSGLVMSDGGSNHHRNAAPQENICPADTVLDSNTNHTCLSAFIIFQPCSHGLTSSASQSSIMTPLVPPFSTMLSPSPCARRRSRTTFFCFSRLEKAWWMIPAASAVSATSSYREVDLRHCSWINLLVVRNLKTG